MAEQIELLKAEAVDQIRADLEATVQASADAAAGDADQTALDRVATNNAADRSEAARDAAVAAGAWDYTPNDATARAAITGMVTGEIAYQRDTMHVWEYDGAAWVDTGQSPLATKANQSAFEELKLVSYSAIQSIGADDADMDAGAGSDGAGTYVLAQSATQSGKGIKVTLFANGAGTAYVHLASKTGDTFTIEYKQQVPITAGLNVITLPDANYTESWLPGLAFSAGMIAFENGGSVGYYKAAGVFLDVGGSFTDSTVANVQLKVRFDFLDQLATGDNVKEVMDDVTEIQSFVGIPNGAVDQIVGRPEGTTLVTGAGIGTPYYIFEGVADVDRYNKPFSVWATEAGTMQVHAWSVDGAGDVALERQVGLPVTIGLNTFADVGLKVNKGERFGLSRGTANLALNNDAINPTRYRSITATSGTPSAITSTLRFEFTAVLEPDGLSDRLARLENGDTDANLLPTLTYFGAWMLGESHPAGRATTLSPSVIPDGRGYTYLRATGAMGHLQDPTGNDSTAIAGAGRGSWGPAAGRALLDVTRGAIGAAIVNSGSGSTTIGNHWADGGPAWIQAKADWADAKSKMDTLNKSLCGCAAMISIGSNDAAAGTTKSAFKAGFIDLITRVRTELGYDVPILILPTGPFSDGSDAAAVAYVQEAQREIAKEVANCRLVTTATQYAADNGWFMDSVHFNQTGNEAIGTALGLTAFAAGTGNPV